MNIEDLETHNWYVIHTYSGHEAKVKANLDQRIETMNMQDQIFQVVVPTEDVIEYKDAKRREVKRKFLPGYVLVQMNMDDDSWAVVRNTPGVTGFVGLGRYPTPLLEREVHEIMRQMGLEEVRSKTTEVSFKVGQRARIIDGPFSDNFGVIKEINLEKKTVKVMVVVFNRETSVELDFSQIEED
ncbi:MAG: transcription termination/antitermination protein NusG [bacterium]|nr:transcription termination/antitermination protein NusG [bacterium]